MHFYKTNNSERVRTFSYGHLVQRQYIHFHLFFDNYLSNLMPIACIRERERKIWNDMRNHFWVKFPFK